MQLTAFISDLINKGEVIIPNSFHEIKEDDEQACIKILEAYYESDKLEYAYIAPNFSDKASLCAAKYFYLALQLTIIRDADDTAIKEKLALLEEIQTPSVIYSADLIFRYLPTLLSLIKGLAPSDPLVKSIEQTLITWNLSSPGVEFDLNPNIEKLIKDDFLWQLFIDRIIEHKDKKFLRREEILDSVSATLGKYSKILWPEFDDLLKRINEQ